MKPPIYNYTKKTKMIVFSTDDFAKFIQSKFPTIYKLNMATVELRMNNKSYIGVLLEDVIFLPEQADAKPTSQYKDDNGIDTRIDDPADKISC